METFSKLRPPDAVRIKVKLVERDLTPRVKQVKKFCVDPMVTSYDILFNLICQTFSIKSSTDNDTCADHFIALYNDWDLDAAFLNASQPYLSLNVELKKADQSDTVYDEWEVIHSTESALTSNQLKRIRLNNPPDPKHPAAHSLNRSFISSAADKAVSVLSRVFSLNRSHSAPVAAVDHTGLFDLDLMAQSVRPRPPLGEPELQNFMDCDGRIVQPQELRQRIFEGGCEPSQRRLLWPILLDIFPDQHMSLAQRVHFISQKSVEYKNLKHSLWYNSNKLLHQNSCQIVSDSSFDSSSSDEHQLHHLAHKIYKDVWRTDRNHKFYSGESNNNTESLFNILMTYTLSNRGQPYCQGMSDLLSPLLYVLQDEPLAYHCFCALMARCSQSFQITSDSITSKIRLLASLIQKFDPDLWAYLSQVGAEQLLFVYRWLLIECKREFPFGDSLLVFEVMWSSIQSARTAAATASHADTRSPNNNNDCSSCRVCRKNTDTETDTDIESVNGFNYYNHLRRHKERRKRRLSLNASFYSHKSKSKFGKFKPSSLNTNCFLSELREQQYKEKKMQKTRRVRAKKRCRSVDSGLGGNASGAARRCKSELNLRASYDHAAKRVPLVFAKKLKWSLLANSGSSMFSEADRPGSSTSSELSDHLAAGSIGGQIEQKVKRKILFKNVKKSLEKSHVRITKQLSKYKSSASSTSAYVSAGSVLSSASSVSSGSNAFASQAPADLHEEQLVHELSKLDNPFLLFVCFAMFLENRQLIIGSQMDANDIACFFDKMTRRHNVKSVLLRARYLYAKLYLAKVNAFSYIQHLMDIQNSP
ncbi:TBC1 domain family member 25 [Brachionus plicatilis]|uniref:TBC1 domain family member 25 n=1 Tax=Brachionus plicatilis TaxID=10195 RepID=A0A3M7R6V4_BRAPC|nr:TBC1 domain family member 25 [Brachionus plicatilis]